MLQIIIFKKNYERIHNSVHKYLDKIHVKLYIIHISMAKII